jgi:hypothetical protein
MRLNRTIKVVIIVLALVAGVFFAVARQSSFYKPQHNFKGSLHSANVPATQNTLSISADSPAKTGQTQIDSHDLELCRNEKAGYKFVYPAKWFAYGEGSTNPNTRLAEKETPCVGSTITVSAERLSVSPYAVHGDQAWLMISVYDEQRNAGTVLQGVTDVPGYISHLKPATQAALEETIVGEERAITWVDSEGIRTVVMFHNSLMFELRTNNLSFATLDAILSSFVFLR